MAQPVQKLTCWLNDETFCGSFQGRNINFSLFHCVEAGSGTRSASYSMNISFSTTERKATLHFHLVTRLILQETLQHLLLKPLQRGA
jgi:hypothetical protein